MTIPENPQPGQRVASQDCPGERWYVFSGLEGESFGEEVGEVRSEADARLLVHGAEAVAMLKSLEWSGTSYRGGHRACPECCVPTDHGHRDYCRLAALLRAFEEKK